MVWQSIVNTGWKAGKKMNLMITGALGHIGSRLIRELPLAMFQNVYLLDNLSTQRFPSLFDLPKGIPFRFIEDDILTANLEEYFKGVDVVIHLAAITNAEASVAIADEVERTNFKGTERVAEACAACGSKMVFISTTSVYGLQDDEVDENCPVDHLQPQSPYAESKLKAELLLQTIGEREGLSFITCRFGTVFGVSTGMRFHTAVNKFVWQASTGCPLTIWSTAIDQKRPYLDLGDAVEALKFILQIDLFDCRTYNIVTTNATVRQIINIISSLVPDVSIQYADSKIMNQLSYTVSNLRFRNQGFEFKGSLDQGISETVQLLQGVRHR
jgi:nucleoside-diphosphate-sugar epimerase